MDKKRLNYINFLRSISIISVFLFHLEIVKGGFLGVDFFFIISGFLIFKVYDEKYKYQKKGIKNFLISRFKRVVPALYMCLIVAWVLFALILSGNELRDFGQSIISSSLFLSNLLFWTEAGYYQPISELKPLLHTWSLSVEMHFYLFIIFLCFLKKNFIFFKNVTYFLLFLFIFSIIGSEFKNIFLFQIYTGLENSSIFDFFLITSRIWEFISGILIYIFIKKNKKKKYLFVDYYFYGSLVIVICSIFLFNKDLDHPGFFTLIPIFGFSSMMYFLNYKNNYYLIKNKFLNFTGQISYSLYLYHFIFIVFVKHYFLNELTEWLVPLFVIFVYLVSYISYLLVEKKFYFND